MDFMGWWKYLVKEHGIAPSEAWSMRFIDAVYMAEMKQVNDTSFMVNEIRKMNGATSEFLVNG